MMDVVSRAYFRTHSIIINHELAFIPKWVFCISSMMSFTTFFNEKKECLRQTFIYIFLIPLADVYDQLSYIFWLSFVHWLSSSQHEPYNPFCIGSIANCGRFHLCSSHDHRILIWDPFLMQLQTPHCKQNRQNHLQIERKWNSWIGYESELHD